MRDYVYQAVCKAFGRYFEVHPTRVHLHHHLQRDWGLDASELGLIAEHIEEIAGIEFDDHGELAEIQTVAELVQLVRKRLRRAAREAEHAPEPDRARA